MGLGEFVQGIGESVGKSVVNSGKAIGWAATHPDKVAKGVGFLAEHPGMWGGVAKKMLIDQVTDPVSLATNVALIAGTGGAALGIEGAVGAAKVTEGITETAKVGEGVAEAAKAGEGVTEAAKTGEGVAKAANAGRAGLFRGAVSAPEDTPGFMGTLDRALNKPSELASKARSALGQGEYSGIVRGTKARLAEKLIPNAEGVGTLSEAGRLAPDLSEAGALKQAAYNMLNPASGKPVAGGLLAENSWRAKQIESAAQTPDQLKKASGDLAFAADPKAAIAKKAYQDITDPKHWWNQPTTTAKPAAATPLQQPVGNLQNMTSQPSSQPSAQKQPPSSYSPGRGFSWGERTSYGSGLPWTQQHAEFGGVNVGTDWRDLNRSLSYGSNTLPGFGPRERQPKSTPEQPAANSAKVRGGPMSREDIANANEGIVRAWGAPRSQTGYRMPGGDIADSNEGLATSSWGPARSNTGYPMPQGEQDSANQGIARAWGSSLTQQGGPGPALSKNDINSNLSNWQTGSVSQQAIGATNKRLSSFQFGQGEI